MDWTEDATQVRTCPDFDRRFARPYQLNLPAIEAAIAACPKILTDVYAMGLIDGMTGCRRTLRFPANPTPAAPDAARSE